MSTLYRLLDAYGESHRNPVNKRIHWICVPAIMISLLGILWSIPRPELFAQFGPFANWATLVVVAAMAYYLKLSLPIFTGMLLVSAAMLAAVFLLDQVAIAPLWALSIAIFVAAWIGQFIGHRIEGKKPSFLEDVQMLLIGPAWLLADAYRKAGIHF